MAKAKDTKQDTTQSADALRRKAYATAEKTLREKYAEEFRALVTAEAEKLGVEYKFRKTPEERAREQYEDLLRQFPALREQPVTQED